jgi:hypothetical protein
MEAIARAPFATKLALRDEPPGGEGRDFDLRMESTAAQRVLLPAPFLPVMTVKP